MHTRRTHKTVSVDRYMKKKAGIILILIVAAVVLVPIALYGPQVNVAQVSMGLSVTSPLPSGLLAEADALQIPSFLVGIGAVNVEVSSMSSHQYMWARNTARTQVSDSSSFDQAIVEISITFNLTTPANISLVSVLNPGSGRGTGDKVVTILMGPEDGLSTAGQFHLRITITVKVTPPGFDTPVVNLTLDPVDRTFTVPQSG